MQLDHTQTPEYREAVKAAADRITLNAGQLAQLAWLFRDARQQLAEVARLPGRTTAKPGSQVMSQPTPQPPPAHARPVVFDGWCGEPVAWEADGERVIGRDYRPSAGSHIAYTHTLTPAVAADRYGPVSEIVVGPGGGFRQATYGDITFTTKWLDPRPHPDLMTTVHLRVDDPIVAMFACPRCGASKGEPCEGVATRHRARDEAARK